MIDIILLNFALSPLLSEMGDAIAIAFLSKLLK